MAEIVENPRFKDESISQEILSILTSKLDFTIPGVDYSDLDVSFPDKLIEELSKTPEMPVPGNLASDNVADNIPSYNRIMNAFRATLADEADKDRIDKNQYATILQAVMPTAMQLAVEYELNRYTNKYASISAAIKAKVDVVTAKTQAAIAKMQLAQTQSNAHTARVQFASTVMDLGIKDSSYGLNQQNIKVAQENIKVSEKQIEQMSQNIASSIASVSRENRVADKQIEQVTQNIQVAQKQIEQMNQSINASVASVSREDRVAAENIKVSEKQIEQISQNINASVASVTRDDNLANKQIELMGQNIASSKASVTRDDMIADQQVESSKLRDVRDLGKVYSDVYLTQKGVDEGTATPSSLTSTNIDEVMTKLRTMHKL